jgi:uncharacterized membrane protein YGL010W
MVISDQTSNRTQIPLYISDIGVLFITSHFRLDPAQQRSPDNLTLAPIPLLPFPCLPRQLLLRLLIPVCNQLVQEAAGLALVVAVVFGLFYLPLQVLAGLFIGFVGGVVRWEEEVSNLREPLN